MQSKSTPIEKRERSAFNARNDQGLKNAQRQLTHQVYLHQQGLMFLRRASVSSSGVEATMRQNLATSLQNRPLDDRRMKEYTQPSSRAVAEWYPERMRRCLPSMQETEVSWSNMIAPR